MKRPLSPFEQELVNAMDEYAHRAVPPSFNATRIVARERQRVRMRLSIAAVCVATAAGIASCVATSLPSNGNNGLPVVGNTSTPVSVPTSAAPASSTASPNTHVSPSGTTGGLPSAGQSGGPSSVPGSGASSWPTGPTSSPFTGTVPPVPVLNSLTYGRTALGGYAMFDFRFAGQVPGFTARYVSQVVHEGSGAPISMPGSAFLQLTFRSAQAHDDSGNPTLNPPATNPVSTGIGTAPAYVVNGDFEGTVTITIGVSGKRGFHITEQTISPTSHVIQVVIGP